LTANAGDQVNQLRAEIARLQEEHKANMTTMEETHTVEKQTMQGEFAT